MVQRTSAGGISQQGRSATGVRVMNLKDDDLVSAVALVVDTGVAGDPQEGSLPDDDMQPEATLEGSDEEQGADPGPDASDEQQ
jgi:DNA gyrase subunit A